MAGKTKIWYLQNFNLLEGMDELTMEYPKKNYL